VLFLAAGDYQLSDRLEVSKSISLIGTGQATTNVFSSASQAVLRFRDGALHLKGISFIHTGKQTADVLDVKDARIKIEDCRFTGGYSSDTPRTDGDGIWIHGRSSGSIIKSRFERNALNGLEMTGDSSIKLEQNEFMRNESSGLAVFKNARLQVVGNRIEFNKKKGIQVSDQASVRLVQNKIMFNSGSGVAFFDTAKGTVNNNTLIANKFGVVINDQSTVDVLQNFFSNHTEALYISNKALATIGQNSFQKNTKNLVREK
jgi:parallel beta-helix repeat protein